MKTTSRMSRRQFVGGTAAAAALAAARPLPAFAQAAPRFKIIGFSKPFAHLNFDDTADLLAEVGMVPRRFLTNLKQSSFEGPLCQHHEYENLGRGAEMVANLKKDLATLRQWLG